MTAVDDHDPGYWTDDEEPELDYDPLADPEAIDRLLAQLNPQADVPTPTDELDPDPDLDALLTEPEPAYDWLIPDVIERGDRVILTGHEGTGKSTLLRQLAVQCASGIHPFTLEDMDPLTVLFVDLENSRKQSKRKLRPLRIAAGERYPAKLMHPVIHGQGLDLTTLPDQIWLDERIRADRPDLLFIGPIYKMVGGDPTEEEPARKVVNLLDQMREHYGIAMFIEAHSPHAQNGSKRVERPYGASIWVRWPEFGLHLAPTGQLNHWRGDRDERQWPAALKRGGDWPWSPELDPKAHTFARVLDLLTERGQVLSYRELADELGVSKSWIEKVIKANPANQDQYDELCRRISTES